MLQQPWHPDMVDGYADSPAMNASAGGHAEVVRLLLDAGTKIDLANAGGTTALMLVPTRTWATLMVPLHYCQLLNTAAKKSCDCCSRPAPTRTWPTKGILLP